MLLVFVPDMECVETVDDSETETSGNVRKHSSNGSR